MPSVRERARRPLPVLAASGLVAAGLLGTGGAAVAEGPFTLTTPYPAIETQPGSTVKLDVDVATVSTDAVDLALGGLPDGWTATMRGGGFVIHSVTSSPDTPAKASLEIDVPPTAGPGAYPITADRDIRDDLPRIVFEQGGRLLHLTRDGADLDAIYHRYFRDDEDGSGAGPVHPPAAPDAAGSGGP